MLGHSGHEVTPHKHCDKGPLVCYMLTPGSLEGQVYSSFVVKLQGLVLAAQESLY